MIPRDEGEKEENTAKKERCQHVDYQRKYCADLGVRMMCYTIRARAAAPSGLSSDHTVLKRKKSVRGLRFHIHFHFCDGCFENTIGWYACAQTRGVCCFGPSRASSAKNGRRKMNSNTLVGVPRET